MKVWHPIRWKSLRNLARVREGDAVRNPVADARGSDWKAVNAAYDLAERIDAGLAERGLRIDNTACVVGWVVRS